MHPSPGKNTVAPVPAAIAEPHGDYRAFANGRWQMPVVPVRFAAMVRADHLINSLHAADGMVRRWAAIPLVVRAGVVKAQLCLTTQNEHFD